jgi:hypothetical protein
VKIKQGNFIHPKVRKGMEDRSFDDRLSSLEKVALNALKAITANFLGNVKACNYDEHAKVMQHAFNAMGCSMSFKKYYLPPY